MCMCIQVCGYVFVSVSLSIRVCVNNNNRLLQMVHSDIQSELLLTIKRLNL